MKFFYNLSIKNKLVVIILFVSAITIGIATIVLTFDDANKLKVDMINHMEVNAKLIGEYCIAPLSFRDSLTATSVIKKVEAVPAIISGGIYDRKNKLFASYQKMKKDEIPDTINPNEKDYFEAGYLKIFSPIEYKGIRYGTVYLKISTMGITEKTSRQVSFAVFLFLGTLVLTYFLASKLQNVISKPILDLAGTTSKIALEKDYTPRVHKQRSDEIGILYDSFNEMLTQINIHEEGRNKSEELLRESEEKYRSLVRNIQAAIIVHAPDTRIEIANLKAQELLGLTGEQMLGKTVIDPDWYFFKEDGSRMPIEEYPVNQVIKTNKPLTNYIAGIHRSNLNDNIWVLVSADPVFSKDNELQQVIVSFVDLTELNNAKEMLYKERNLLRIVINNIPDGIWTKDLKCRKTLANLANVHMMGIKSVEEVLGKDDYELFPKELADGFMKDDLSVLKTGKPVINREEYVYDEKGQKHFLLTTKLPFKDEKGQIIGIIGISRDISERKHAEEVLAEREQEFRSLAENSPDNIIRYDRQCRAIYCNKKIFTSEPETILGKTPTELGFGGLENDAKYEEHIMRVLESGNASELELDIQKHNGELENHLIRFVPEKNQDGDITGVLTIGQDITERKHMEKALRKSEERYRKAQEIGHVGSWEFNIQTGMFWGSDEAKRIYGFNLNTDEFTTEEVENCISERERVHQALDDLIEFDKPYNLEFDIITKNTKIRRTILSIAELERDTNSNPIKLTGVIVDITERNIAKEMLYKERNLLRTVIDNLPDGVWTKDLKCRKTLANRKDVDMVGLKSEEKVLGKDDYELYPKELADGFMKDDLSVLQTGKPVVDKEEYVIDEKGNKHFLLTTKLPFKDEKNRIIGLIGISHDITERKKAEEKILHSEQRLRLHAEQSPLGFLEWDENFCASEWNAACEQIFGYKREEAIGKHAKDLVLPENAKGMVDEIFHSLMNETGGQHSINENITKDGRIITCEWFNTTLVDKDGKAIGIASICNDITERKKMEEALVAREQEFRTLAENSPDSISRYDVNCKTIYVNSRLAKAFQKSASDILNKTPTENKSIKGYDEFNAKIVEVLKTGNSTELDLVDHLKDGKKTYYNIRFVAERDEKNSIIGVLAIGRDVTERKLAEIEIQKLNQELEQRVMNRTIQLEAANKELEAFAYSVSHDLRAPLRSIDGFSQVLLEDYYEKLDAEGKDHLYRVRAAAQRMAQLIDDILRLSRLSRDVMNIETVNLSDLARKIMREFKDSQPKRDVNIKIHDGIIVKGDEKLLRIALENLLGNAWKFTSKHQKADIEFGMIMKEGKPIYYVKDDGAGFDMTYSAKLFGAFQRFHTIKEFPGTGIGLATVQRIIRRHGGSVWAESEVEKGATFYFTLREE